MMFKLGLRFDRTINLFVLDNFPRLSVDIDLVYLPIEDRSNSLEHIEKGLKTFSSRLQKKFPTIEIVAQLNNQTKKTDKLMISLDGTNIKVEANHVIRGTIFKPEKRDLADVVVSQYGLTILDMPIASVADLYGGKICAALDRQHPRDLFDIKILLETIGITENIRKAFIGYLCSHKRPMSEVLNPNLSDERKAYQSQFVGMVDSNVTYEELEITRKQLIHQINQALTEDERAFLISFKKGEPEWQKSGINHLSSFPSVKWKLQNIQAMADNKRQISLDKLYKVLYEN